MPVAVLKMTGPIPVFPLKKYACLLAKDTAECVPVTIIISKLYGNELILPVGALVSCSLILTCSRKKRIALIKE